MSHAEKRYHESKSEVDKLTTSSTNTPDANVDASKHEPETKPRANLEHERIISTQATSKISSKIPAVPETKRPTDIQVLTGACRLDMYTIEPSEYATVLDDEAGGGRITTLLCGGLERPYNESRDGTNERSITFAGLLRYIQLIGLGTGHTESAIERLIFSTRSELFDPEKETKDSRIAADVWNASGDRADGHQPDTPLNIRSSIRHYLRIQRKRCERNISSGANKYDPRRPCFFRAEGIDRPKGNTSQSPQFCSFGDALSFQRQTEIRNIHCSNRNEKSRVQKYEDSVRLGAHEDPVLEILRTSKGITMHQIPNPKQFCRYYLGLPLISGYRLQNDAVTQGTYDVGMKSSHYSPYCNPLDASIQRYQRETILPILENVRYYISVNYSTLPPESDFQVAMGRDDESDGELENAQYTVSDMVRALLEAPPLGIPEFNIYGYERNASFVSREILGKDPSSAVPIKSPFQNIFKAIYDEVGSHYLCRSEGLRNQISQRGTAEVLYGIHKREHFTTVQTLRREIDRLIDFRGSAFSSRLIDAAIDAFTKVFSKEDMWLFPDGMYIVLKICQGPIDKKRMSDVFHTTKDRRSVVFASERLVRVVGMILRTMFMKEGGGLQHDTRWKRVVGESQIQNGTHVTNSMRLHVDMNASEPHMNMGWFKIDAEGNLEKHWPRRSGDGDEPPIRIGFGELALLFLNPNYVRENRWLGPSIEATRALRSLESFIQVQSWDRSYTGFVKRWVLGAGNETKRREQEKQDQKAKREAIERKQKRKDAEILRRNTREEALKNFLRKM